MNRTLALAVPLLLLAGCSSPAPAKSAACEPFDLDRAAQILAGSGMTADAAGAVRSTEHSNAWYVAIRFSGSGVKGEVGVWATNDLAAGSAVAVDSFAQEFSDLPTNANFASTDKGVGEARTCV